MSDVKIPWRPGASRQAVEARAAREESLTIPYDSRNIYYEFDTEYWNDELHSYQYFINSRCFESEEAGG